MNERDTSIQAGRYSLTGGEGPFGFTLKQLSTSSLRRSGFMTGIYRGDKGIDDQGLIDRSLTTMTLRKRFPPHFFAFLE